MTWFSRKRGASDELLQALAIGSSLEKRNAELVTRNLEVSKMNVELTRANVELAREVLRLSQRQNPELTDEVIEDPPTTRDADMKEARRPEQSQMPATKGRHHT